MTLKGLGSALDDEEKVRPIPGTNAHLMWTEKQKKLKAEAVDNSQKNTPLTDVKNTTHVKITPVVKTTSHVKNKPRVKHTPRVITTPKDPATVKIINNYVFRDADICSLMRELTANEFKVYNYFLSISYEVKFAPRQICSTTHPIIQTETAISSNKTIGVVVESLEAKGLIKRLVTARKAGEMSLYRVYLPCERPGYTGETLVADAEVQKIQDV